jgi:hypothetical protein
MIINAAYHSRLDFIILLGVETDETGKFLIASQTKLNKMLISKFLLVMFITIIVIISTEVARLTGWLTDKTT